MASKTYQCIVRSLAAASICLTFAGACLAQGSDIYSLKAALNYNFAKFTKWPGPQRSRIYFCYLSEPFSPSFESLEGRKVTDRAISTILIKALPELDRCDLVFVDKANRSLLQRLFIQVDGKPILTVSDIAGFHSEGGMIEIVTIDNKFRFLINLRALEKSKISLSSQLLKLAVDVKR
jgi:hypothetical protein